MRFYQGMLQLIAGKPEVADLLEFGEVDEITAWSEGIRGLLPGSLGAALASAHGKVFGNPREQRVGPACATDIRRLQQGQPIDYPPLHTDIPGLEHFDLITHLQSPGDATGGTVFVSFKLSILTDLLENMSSPGDRFELLDSSDRIHLQTGADVTTGDTRRFRMSVPETSWELQLSRAIPASHGTLVRLVGADLLILALAGVLIVFLVRSTLSGFARDMQRVQTALADVLEGKYQPSSEPTAIRETGLLLPNIEQLALRLQDQRSELRQQSLSDPLTGVFNRRYFDMMLVHLHEQSRRQSASHLLIIDLNDFKQVNDAHGHQAGDRVLQTTARFLVSRVRATDIVARLGGDEFALILTHMAEEALAPWVASLLAGYDAQALDTHEGQEVYCRLSVGVATIDAARYASAHDVFDHADRIMYRVKQQRELRRSQFAVAAQQSSDTRITETGEAR
jgi:diguanylate cyclase (GGDEF)-like protein